MGSLGDGTVLMFQYDRKCQLFWPLFLQGKIAFSR